MFSDVESVEERSRMKKNKPAMEKRRRARINRCLAELKQILITDRHASAGHAKWEKADILEMTVEYVRRLRENKGMSNDLICQDETSASQSSILPLRPISPSPTPSRSDSLSSDKPEKVSIHQPSLKRKPPVSPATVSSTTVSSKRHRPAESIQSSPVASQPLPPPSAATSLLHPSVAAAAAPLLSSPLTPPTLHQLMAHQLFAMQHYHHSLKYAAMAPALSMAPIGAAPIWRPM